MNNTIKKYSFLIVDDHKMIQDGLKSVVSQHFIDAKIHFANNQHSIIETLNSHKINLILLDLFLENEDSRTFLNAIFLTQPDVKIIVVSSLSDIEVVNALLLSGVSGFVNKASSSDRIVKAIKLVLNGEQFLDPSLQQKKKQHAIISLTKREQEVLVETLKGKKIKEIALTLFISKKSVENHRNNLFIKFGVNNVASLVKEAILLGFLPNE